MPPNWLLPLTSSPMARAWLSQTSRIRPSATNHTEWLATIAVSLCSLAFPQPPGPAERLGWPPRTHPFIPLTGAGLAVLAARAFPRGPTPSTTSDRAQGCGWSWPLCAVLARATCRFATGSCPSVTSYETLGKHHHWGATSSDLFRAQVKTVQGVVVGHGMAWLCGHHTVLRRCGRWNHCVLTAVLAYEPLAAVSAAFQKMFVCVCVRGKEREREKPGFSVFTTNLCSKAARPPLA